MAIGVDIEDSYANRSKIIEVGEEMKYMTNFPDSWHVLKTTSK